MDPRACPVMAQIFTVVFWTTPAFFLLQLSALGVLLWWARYRWRPEALGTRSVERWALELGVAVAPIVMLLISAGRAMGLSKPAVVPAVTAVNYALLFS